MVQASRLGTTARILVNVFLDGVEAMDSLRGAAVSFHANCYFAERVNIDKFHSVVKAFEDFWFAVDKLPSE